MLNFCKIAAGFFIFFLTGCSDGTLMIKQEVDKTIASYDAVLERSGVKDYDIGYDVLETNSVMSPYKLVISCEFEYKDIGMEHVCYVPVDENKCPISNSKTTEVDLLYKPELDLEEASEWASTERKLEVLAQNVMIHKAEEKILLEIKDICNNLTKTIKAQ